MSNKSEAAWHPNSGPEVPHADLIARLDALDRRGGLGFTAHSLVKQAIAALGDTVPREQHDQMRADRFSEGWTAAHAHFTPQITTVERERDEARAEARAERDSLAHVIEQARRVSIPEGSGSWRDRAAEVETILCTAPAVSLALRDAEVWDEGVRAKSASSSIFDADVLAENPYRAAAIREEAK